MDETQAERETQNFMDVESFSQLPFFRRPPSKDKNPKPIRLFGQDFTTGDNYSKKNNKEDEEVVVEEEEDQTGDNGKDNSISNNNKRFECHYCFRNFPTSQALGGHQNAHKRERQLAKRGHNDANNLYGYRHYPSWSRTSLLDARFYGVHTPVPSSSFHTRPINGSPLGLWRVPPSSSSVYNSNAAFTSHVSSGNSFLSSLACSQPHPPVQVGGSAAQNRMSSYRYGLSPNVQDHVSLDLNL